MHGPIEMQNTVVITIVTRMANVGITGFHHFDCTMQHNYSELYNRKDTTFST